MKFVGAHYQCDLPDCTFHLDKVEITTSSCLLGWTPVYSQGSYYGTLDMGDAVRLFILA